MDKNFAFEAATMALEKINELRWADRFDKIIENEKRF